MARFSETESEGCVPPGTAFDHPKDVLASSALMSKTLSSKAKSKMGMRHRTQPGARLSSEAPEGTPEATLEVAPNELAKPALVSREHKKNFKGQPIGTGELGKKSRHRLRSGRQSPSSSASSGRSVGTIGRCSRRRGPRKRRHSCRPFRFAKV